MRVPLEDFVPYDRSVRWRLHDAYYSTRGPAAWESGEVPSFATSNFAAARQRAGLVVELVSELTRAGRLGADEPVHVLEVGSGTGKFALNFLRALEVSLGDEGAAVSSRLHYVLSDFAEKNVRDALLGTGLEGAAEEGRVIPALFDMRAPGLRALDGAPLAIAPLVVIANYVACVSPVQVIRRDDTGFSEKWSRAGIETADGATKAPADALAELLSDPSRQNLMERVVVDSEWRAAPLEKLVAPEDLPVIAATLERVEVGALVWHRDWIRALRSLVRALRPGGVVLVSDYGHSETPVIAGHDPEPENFGNTLGHAVPFALYDALCAHEGFGLERTVDPCRSVHVAAIGPDAELPGPFTDRFATTFGANDESETLLDLIAGASACANKADEPKSAARLLERCALLDPFSAELRERAGDGWLASAVPMRALAHYKRAIELEPARGPGLDARVGRAFLKAKMVAEARAIFERALVANRTSEALCNVAVARVEHGEWRSAWAAIVEAQELAPDDERVQGIRARIAERYASNALGEPAPPIR